MAVWTPGSYLVREYERHVENVGRARRRAAAPWPSQKTRRIAGGSRPAARRRVTVSYRVYGREMTVRNNWIEAGFAMLNGAPTFISLVGGTRASARGPHRAARSGWNGLGDGAHARAGQPHTYRAEDFDTLVDSPIILGNPVMREFQVAGKRHYLVLEGDHGVLRHRSRGRPTSRRSSRRAARSWAAATIIRTITF